VNRAKELYGQIEQKYKEIFCEDPYLIRSPGRINLIGEHTDYNEGFVLPAAIDKAIYFAIAPNNRHTSNLYAYDLADSVEVDLKNIQKSDKGWPNYLLGVVDQIHKLGYKVPGFNCVFGGDIPIGAGLSSSAALEAGLAFGLNELFRFNFEPIKLVGISQRAENSFVGVQCGIMDQLINIFGKEKKVLKLDCRSLEHQYFPFERDDLRIVLCDSQVQRSLTVSGYNLRRSQCEQGVQIIRKSHPEIHSLRDVTMDLLNEGKSRMDPVIFKRCKYVIEENERVLGACESLSSGDVQTFGQKMNESHTGLKDEYEVSCRQLDDLVDGALELDGVFGSRMMGAGFGGCTINLVSLNYLESFIEGMGKVYQDKLKKSPQIYITSIKEGTSFINTKIGDNLD
jgi:galactokinase